MGKHPRLVIAGLSGGAGKTTISIGLISALKRRGLDVTPFKKGPDYIDAGWLSEAARRPCYNLDPYLIGEKRILQSFAGHLKGTALIEGNRGLFDGLDASGTASTARLAKMLRAPVILVIDCTKMTRTTAALLLGVKTFDPELDLQGVILNRIAGARHEAVIRESIEKYCPVPVLGSVPKLPSALMPERHMGLTSHQEHSGVAGVIERLGEIMETHIDIEEALKIAGKAPPLAVAPCPNIAGARSPLRIGVVRDSAFQFYYPENFEELQKRGARLIEVSALTDKKLPDVDALYIGGGFPETHAIALAKNKAFKGDLRKAVESGLPVYAECGGLMYLGESLILNGKTYPMAGILHISFSLEEKPEAHGYTVVEVVKSNPFYEKGVVLRGHEFHYSRVIGLKKGKDMYMAFKMKRGKGIADKLDGFCYKNVFATYTHLHALGAPEWADGLLRAAEGATSPCDIGAGSPPQ